MKRASQEIAKDPARMRAAERGIQELQQHVHTLIIIPNQNLFRVANDRTTFAQAFGTFGRLWSSR